MRILVLVVGRLVDLDGALEVGAVLDHDARGGEVAVYRAVLLDFDPILGPQIALHRAVNHDFAGDDIGSNFGGGADRQLPLIELDQSFDGSIDQQILTCR